LLSSLSGEALAAVEGMPSRDKFSHLTGTESKIRAALSGNALFDQE
ncbi:hypothetical protein T08_4061, partial [Trichinella sp. T8]